MEEIFKERVEEWVWKVFSCWRVSAGVGGGRGGEVVNGGREEVKVWRSLRRETCGRSEAGGVRRRGGRSSSED